MATAPSRLQQGDVSNLANGFRLDANRVLNPKRRSELGQFFTPPVVARFMASMFGRLPQEVSLLDAGAGVGSLTAAFVDEAVGRNPRPRRIDVVTYEKDATLLSYLDLTLSACAEKCEQTGVAFSYIIHNQDFIEHASDMLEGGLFSTELSSFNFAILNPPYKKIRSNSLHRHVLSRIGVETSNLYTSFLALVVGLLEPDGELVAITPRSFCNGPYFRHFRTHFLSSMALKRIHIYESRETAFAEEDVLQENIIFCAAKATKHDKVIISKSVGPEDINTREYEVNYRDVVRPDDPEQFIRISGSSEDRLVDERMRALPCTLADLGIQVSTGRVVEFRSTEFLRAVSEKSTAPLIYPTHMDSGFIRWPKLQGRKPNAIVKSQQTESLLLPRGHYVVVRRFSAKEERRRVMAAIFDPDRLSEAITCVGFENHLNVYHSDSTGLSPELAKGLATYLNSTLVDTYFRLFNGHTQVNANDLRALRYPSLDKLKLLGTLAGNSFPEETEIDTWLERELHYA